MNEYAGEESGRRTKIVLALAVSLALLGIAAWLLGIQATWEPLHTVLSDVIPKNAPIWDYVGTPPSEESEPLPPAANEPAHGPFETVIGGPGDHGAGPRHASGVPNSDADGPPDGVAPKGDTPGKGHDASPGGPDAPGDGSGASHTGAHPGAGSKSPGRDPEHHGISVPSFGSESDRTLSREVKHSAGRTDTVPADGDAVSGTVTWVYAGNALAVDGIQLVLSGVQPGGQDARDLLMEACKPGSHAILDLDDRKGQDRDSRIYAKVWCFADDIPDRSANQLMLESGTTRIDFSCVGSEFAGDPWSRDAGCWE